MAGAKATPISWSHSCSFPCTPCAARAKTTPIHFWRRPQGTFHASASVIGGGEGDANTYGRTQRPLCAEHAFLHLALVRAKATPICLSHRGGSSSRAHSCLVER
eukprot:scaffold40041_cov33-Tisochrysis_lutea.AAC.4